MTKRPSWEESVDFNGGCVPQEVLAEVYRIAGFRYQWTEPGRNFRLPPAARQRLRKWKSDQKGDLEAYQGLVGELEKLDSFV